MREEEGYGGFRDFGELLRHELNNPLTGILGNAELLLVEMERQPQPAPDLLRARLETIASLAVRMRETVRRLSEDWRARAVHHATLPEDSSSTEAFR